MPQNGLITLSSRYTARDTMDRLLAALAKRDMTGFARIDHAAGAASAGLSLRPTDVVIFGNPKGGTALMQDRQTAGIDLPLKALVWQDADGKVWATRSKSRGASPLLVDSGRRARGAVLGNDVRPIVTCLRGQAERSPCTAAYRWSHSRD
jgi:uncharacterized protein (DUF302 family)